MKSYNSFLGEATEKDLQQMGANQKQIDILKKRQEKRGSGFSKPKEQGSHFQQQGTQQAKVNQINAKSKRDSQSVPMRSTQQKSLPSSVQKKDNLMGVQRMDPKSTALAKTGPSNLAQRGIQTAKEKRVKDNQKLKSRLEKSGALARTNPSSSRTGKETIGAPRKSGPGERVETGPGSKTYDRINPDKTHKKGGALMAPDEAAMRRERELNKKLDKEGGFGRFAKKQRERIERSAANAFDRERQPKDVDETQPLSTQAARLR